MTGRGFKRYEWISQKVQASVTPQATNSQEVLPSQEQIQKQDTESARAAYRGQS
jgi:hypothetical protein